MMALPFWVRRLYLPLMLLLTFFVEYGRFQQRARGFIWSDAEGYYAYLPGVFNLPSIHHVPEGSMNVRKNEWGAVVIKYTCGVALFQLPFYLAARAYSDATGVDRLDIYHDNYAAAAGLAGFAACALGMWLLQRALRRRGFAEPTIALTLLAVLAGTNLLHYVTKEPGMSHVYSFCLVAGLLLHLPRYYSTPTLKNAAVLGALMGWLILIRPTAAMLAVFILLYDVYAFRALGDRIQWWLSRWLHLLLMGVVVGLFLLPQLFYWHEMTGHWVRYSYEGEDFRYWSSPKILEVLFDTQNGLLTYSPVVLLALIGLFIGRHDRRVQTPGLSLLFAIATYVFASWWAWWFGGAFGHRCYVEYYALLALPLAYTLERMLQWRSVPLRMLGLAGVSFLIFYGGRMVFLYATLPTPWDGPDWRWNFGKLAWLWSNLFRF